MYFDFYTWMFSGPKALAYESIRFFKMVKVI